MFPCERIFDHADWQYEFLRFWKYDPERFELWNQFYQNIIKRFDLYHIPVIELGKETPKEAVCAVFEKVNTGGVTLTVFELLTATFAADGYELRKDWDERHRALRQHRILTNFSNTDFLQGITLLASWERRVKALEQESDMSRAPAIGCRRVEMLNSRWLTTPLGRTA